MFTVYSCFYENLYSPYGSKTNKIYCRFFLCWALYKLIIIVKVGKSVSQSASRLRMINELKAEALEEINSQIESTTTDRSLPALYRIDA